MEAEFAPYHGEPTACVQVSQLACIALWRDLLLIGHLDGLLTVFRAEATAGDPNSLISWKKTMTKRLGQKVVQLLVAGPDRNLLFSLTDDGVNLHSLPQLLLKGQATKTNGAFYFAWNDSSNMLAVAVRKRIVVYKYDGLEFLHQREVPLQDPVVSLRVIGSTVIYASKREVVANLQSGQSQLVSKVVSSGSPTLAFSKNSVIVTQGRDSIMVSEKGVVASSEGPIRWSDSPSAVAVVDMHAAALLPGVGVELQLMSHKSSIRLSQLIKMQNAEILAVRESDLGIFVASSTSGKVDYICRVPLLVVAEQLLQTGAYEDALDLCRTISEEKNSVERAKMEARIRVAYGTDLLSKHRYEEAMFHLTSTNLYSPIKLLQNFPFLVTPALLRAASVSQVVEAARQSSDHIPFEDVQKAVSILTPYLLSYRSRLSSGATTGGAMTGDDAQYGIASKQAFRVLIDTALLNAFLILPDNGALLQFLQRPNHVDFVAGRSALESAGRYAEMVQLYRVHDKHRAALELLKNLSLGSSGRLEKSPQGAAAELKGPPGAWAAVKYILSLDPPEFNLMAVNAGWILDLDSEAGVDMFVNLYPQLDPSAVLPLLCSFQSAFGAAYLQKIIDKGAERCAYEQELALLYVHQLMDNIDAPPRQRIADDLRDLIVRSQRLDYDGLLRRLPTSGFWEIRASLLERMDRHMDALRIFVHNLCSIRLAEAYCDRVLARLRSSRRFDSCGNDVNNLYAVLVKVMLEEKDPNRPGIFLAKEYASEHSIWKDIAFLLSRKLHAIHALHALRLLPEGIPLSNCLQLLEASIRSMNEDRRKTTVSRNLYRARHVAAISTRASVFQRSFTLSQDRVCSICQKRIGSVTIVCLPNSTLAHYSCFRRSRT